MDLLSGIVGSATRADVLAALFGGQRRSYGVRDLARALRRPHQSLAPELKRLLELGVVRRNVEHGHHLYEADLTRPSARELAGLVRQARGQVPRIRAALDALRTPALAWVCPGPIPDPDAPGDRAGLDLVVVSSAPKALVRVQLADIVRRRQGVHTMSIREWVTRLDKGDVTLRRLRRSRKIWILGGWSELRSRERAVIEARRTLERAMSDWQEELSDDWDDDWDPSRVPLAPTR